MQYEDPDEDPGILALRNERFAAIPLPGAGDGVAVMKECEFRFTLLSLVARGTDGLLLTMVGYPPERTCEVDIGRDELVKRVGLLEPWPIQDGVVVASVLDGETFFVRRRMNGVENRILLCNPRELDDEALGRFADRLDEFLAYRSSVMWKLRRSIAAWFS